MEAVQVHVVVAVNEDENEDDSEDDNEDDNEDDSDNVTALNRSVPRVEVL